MSKLDDGEIFEDEESGDDDDLGKYMIESENEDEDEKQQKNNDVKNSNENEEQPLQAKQSLREVCQIYAKK